MSDSYDEVLVPLGDDEVLREKYINYMGGVRVGRILEDMDIFSGNVWWCSQGTRAKAILFWK